MGFGDGVHQPVALSEFDAFWMGLRSARIFLGPECWVDFEISGYFRHEVVLQYTPVKAAASISRISWLIKGALVFEGS